MSAWRGWPALLVVSLVERVLLRAGGVWFNGIIDKELTMRARACVYCNVL